MRFPDSEQWLGFKPAMEADHLIVVIAMCNANPHPKRHGSHLAIDEAAYGLTATTAAPVDRGRIFCIAQRGKRLNIETL